MYGGLDLVLLSFSADQLPTSVKWRATVKNRNAVYEGEASVKWISDTELFKKSALK